MLRTIYLELQEIKANAEAIMFSIAQLEDFMSERETKNEGGRSSAGTEGDKKTPAG